MKTVQRLFLLASALFICGLGYGQIDLDVPNTDKAQVIATDLIVQGSECVGLDCVNGESFGFDTERLKENNLRIHFNDTSVSASFPSNDWRIVINDTNNGGDNYFAIEDATAGTQVFRVDAGAGNNALRVDSQGDVGIGTSNPVVELHVADGDSPTLRLEQNGSSGFTPQTWDVAGNETNFFVRDVTNGSQLPFKIKPGADSNTLVIDSDNQVGIGILTATAKLDVRGNTFLKGVDNTTSNYTLRAVNSDDLVGLYVRNDGRVGIGTDNPSSLLQVQGNDVNASVAVNINNSMSQSGLRLRRDGATVCGVFSNAQNDLVFQSGGNNNVGSFEANGDFIVDGNVIASSDKRLKTNIRDYDKGLEAVLGLNPIVYNYSGKAGVTYKEDKIGLIAQELQEVAPEMVSNVEKDQYDNSGELKSKETYLGIHENEIKYLLINSIKEQQEQLDQREEEISKLQSKIDKLESVVNQLVDRLGGEVVDGEITHEETIVLTMDELPYIKQNNPNPYTYETSVEYYIPESAQSAEMQFYNSQSQLISKHILSQKGYGKLNLKANQLPAGTYVYSLVVDGKVISSKKMSIQ